MMPAISEDQKAIWKAVLADPKDPAPKLALADYLAEHGLDRPFEVGLRYCAKENRWPRRDTSGAEDFAWTWDWHFTPKGRAYLRPEIFDKLAFIDREMNTGTKLAEWNCSVFATVKTGIRRLGKTIIALGIKYD